MSVQAMSYVFGLGAEVSGTRRLVLLSLANHANDEGYSWPKRQTIADEAGLVTLDPVTRALSWLAEQGYVEREINGAAGIRGDIPPGLRPNLYRMTFKEGSPRQGSPRQGEGGSPRQGEPGSLRRGEPGSPRRGEQNHKTNRQTKPSDEPQGAPSLFAAPPERNGDPWLHSSFEQFWPRYRVLRGNGGTGSRARAWARWQKEIRSREDVNMYLRRLDNYIAARDLWTELTGEPCALMAAPKWLDEGSEDFDEPMSEHDVRARWGGISRYKPKPRFPPKPGIISADLHLSRMWELASTTDDDRARMLAEAQAGLVSQGVA